jgi:uncharacterized cupin superfamily protein
MRTVNQDSVPEERRISPKGVFEIYRRHVSLAIGGIKDTGSWGGGHPFDIELARIPPGKKNYPYHSHAAQTEYYIVLSGVGIMIDGENNRVSIKAGDHIIVPPGEAHQIINESSADLVYYVLADHHRADVTTYPRTTKRMIKPELRVVMLQEVDYYQDEE